MDLYSPQDQTPAILSFGLPPIQHCLGQGHCWNTTIPGGRCGETLSPPPPPPPTNTCWLLTLSGTCSRPSPWHRDGGARRGVSPGLHTHTCIHIHTYIHHLPTTQIPRLRRLYPRSRLRSPTRLSCCQKLDNLHPWLPSRVSSYVIHVVKKCCKSLCFLVLRCFLLFPHCTPYRGIVWGFVFSLLPSSHVLLFSAPQNALSSCPVCHIVCVVYVGQGTAPSCWYLWLVTNKGIHSFIHSFIC